jgi:putative ABC transport system permease protein
MARTRGDTGPLVGAVQTVIRQMDPDLPLFNISTMERQIASSPTGTLPYRIGAAFAAGQGLIALFLAGLGIFGLVSFNVTRRTHEIGIRMALGATRAGVMQLVARESLALTFIGLLVGLVFSVFLGRMISGLLYEVSPTDPVVFSSVVVVVLCATLLAIWLPARRATNVDPMTALRCE